VAGTVVRSRRGPRVTLDGCRAAVEGPALVARNQARWILTLLHGPARERRRRFRLSGRLDPTGRTSSDRSFASGRAVGSEPGATRTGSGRGSACCWQSSRYCSNAGEDRAFRGATAIDGLGAAEGHAAGGHCAAHRSRTRCSVCRSATCSISPSNCFGRRPGLSSLSPAAATQCHTFPPRVQR
jgi:hypothetical protein